ncbi:MAG TPA: dihydroxyacetone kinase subunit DhaK, partial [Beutenbergiaceae bacterium]|nr:dihydroxyacetone kinase subunit DhaK [Beutenbergiaceae bacterium]
VEAVRSDLDLARGDQVLLLVNGMGGTPLSELYIVYGHARKRLEEQGIDVKRTLVGNYTTALDMQGCSLTVLRLDRHLTDLWDAPVHTPGLNWGK